MILRTSFFITIVFIALLVFIGSAVFGLYDTRREGRLSAGVVNLEKFTNTCLEEHDRAKRIICLIASLQEPIAMHGVRPVMEALERGFLADDSAQEGGITACHDIAHAIGIAGIGIFKDAKTVLASCTELCTYGCYHGAMERYVARGGEVEESLAGLCARVSEKNQSACFHGLGHGVADLAGFDLQRSLALCDKLEREDAQKLCGSGVFMELFEPSTFVHPLLELPQDIPAFCRGMPGVYDAVCFRNSGAYEYARTNHDIKKAFTVCSAAPPHYRWDCREKLGQNLYLSFPGAAAELLRICAFGTPDEYSTCMIGAVMGSLSSDPFARDGFKLCSLIEEEFKKSCYEFLGEHIEHGGNLKRREELCASLSGVEREYCIGSEQEIDEGGVFPVKNDTI